METPESTRQRLLEAAGREFAERGFEGATVRSICERAGANLAAINYHFGSKESLYERAVLEAHRNGVEPLTAGDLAPFEPEEQLRRYVRHFLEQVFGVDEPDDWRHRIMMREMTQPTSASEVLLRELIRPKFETLHGIIARLAPDADDLRRSALAFSVVGQCLFYRVAGRMAARVVGNETYRRLDVDLLTEHITGLMLAALRAPAREVLEAQAMTGGPAR